MLISMPTGTSTILGAFQAIWFSLETGQTLPFAVQGTSDRKVRQQNLLP
jgi:hypothetical protein